MKALLTSLILLGLCLPQTKDTTISRNQEQFAKLVFSDEFENDGKPDANKWHHQTIAPENGGWYNDELQHYTDREKNSYVSDGTLKINAYKENYTTQNSTKGYTSARMNAKYAFTYGKVEVRAKLPTSAGTWPAIWTLGVDVNETGNYFGDQYGKVGWPLCGEIDILEQTGWDKNSTISHFHWGDLNSKEYQNEGGTLSVPESDTGFHVFAMEWTPESIKTFVDDQLVYELPNSKDKPYNHDHYLILNLAIGGNLGGEVTENFTEDTFIIDYVRIYQ
ncbi:glycoside hydrolase family 16 protein [Flagellimonas zhangzhouensis]|uniref:Glycosyl hydrolases family 16 n=1 Tax=Flagellimonas zhangzhouensis TaxID=1073328 RepID=A0A1H2VUP4_9FLAO|nr:glycoside hydrolase family 16 protein [Allomuricauda zhangzhouensis]SDQ05724.1 Glycosyl hydrolases family 16 [Allomuricauda zhangzhouensis]SDW71664.1 Glycosyl hydrolases family 16 [Allomuricauda zhangzhouensis]